MKVLVVAAHPDDADIGMGGTIARFRREDHPVDVLYLTAGENGAPGVTPEDTKVIRMREAELASKQLGYNVLGCWYLPDGSVRYSDEYRDILRELCHQYDRIYVTSHKDSHPDHRTAAKLVMEALKQLDKPPSCYMYEVWTPTQIVDRAIDITNELPLKIEAIKKHDTQVSRNQFIDAVTGLNRYRGVMNGHCTYAEAFTRMRFTGADGMRVALMLLTWSPSIDNPRSQYARTTLESFLDNADFGPHNSLHVHIADDGSDPQHVRELVEIAKKRGYEPTVSNAERGGYGKSYNMATAVLHDSSDIIFPMEDDWQMLRPFNFEELLKSIDDSNGEIGCVRLGYMGFTQELRGKLIHHSGLTFLLLDPNSTEPHIFAGGPRLDTVAFERAVGTWPEGKSPGWTEWDVAHRYSSRVGVAWPMDICIPASQRAGMLFGHIGTVSNAQLEPEGAPA